MSNNISIFIPGRSENLYHPYLYRNFVDLYVMGCIYQGSIMFDENLNFKKRILETFTTTNYKTYNISLKTIVNHNNKYLTTKDIYYSIKLMLSNKAPKYLSNKWINIIGADEFKKKLSADISGIKIIDEFNMIIELIKPDELFINSFIIPFIPYSEKTDTDIFSDKNFSNIGNGPFKLIRKYNSTFYFERFDDFHLGKPLLDTMSISYGDVNKQVELLNNKAIDFTILDADIACKLDLNNDYKIYKLPSPSSIVMFINPNSSLLRSKENRIKLNNVIDKSFVKNAFKGFIIEKFNYYPQNIIPNVNLENKTIIDDNSLKGIPQITIGYDKNNSLIKKVVDLLCERHHFLSKHEISDLKNPFSEEFDCYISELNYMITHDIHSIFKEDNLNFSFLNYELDNIKQIIVNIENKEEYIRCWSNFFNEYLPFIPLFDKYDIQVIKKNFYNLKPDARGVLWNIHEIYKGVN